MHISLFGSQAPETKSFYQLFDCFGVSKAKDVFSHIEETFLYQYSKEKTLKTVHLSFSCITSHS